MDIAEQVAISVGKEPLSDCPLHNTFVPGPSLHIQFVNKLDSQFYWGLYSLFILFYYSFNPAKNEAIVHPWGDVAL